jgi:hypothetical protein
VTIGSLGRFGMFDVGGVIATMGFTVAFLVAALRNGRALYREEPLPGRAPARPRVSLW